jgi:hypothetical protein
MTFAPKTEVYIRVVCAKYKPEYLPLPAFPTTPESRKDDFLPLNLPPLYSPKTQEPSILIENVDPSTIFGNHIRIPRPSLKCTSDPEVGRIAARLNTAVMLTLGILSLITTGYWASVSFSKSCQPLISISTPGSQYSDRVGRRLVLGVSTLAELMANAMFITIMSYANRIPGCYNLFIVCSVIHGTLFRIF